MHTVSFLSSFFHHCYDNSVLVKFSVCRKKIPNALLEYSIVLMMITEAMKSEERSTVIYATFCLFASLHSFAHSFRERLTETYTCTCMKSCKTVRENIHGTNFYSDMILMQQKPSRKLLKLISTTLAACQKVS